VGAIDAAGLVASDCEVAARLDVRRQRSHKRGLREGLLVVLLGFLEGLLAIANDPIEDYG
jgi:hypothetical protein